MAEQKIIQLLGQAQRITAQAVVRGFRTVARSIAEVEAGIVPLEQRLHNQAIAFWVSIHQLDQSHLHWILRRRRAVMRYRLLLQKIALTCQNVPVDGVLEVQTFACPPWVAKLKVVIYKDPEEAQVIVEDRKPGLTDIFTDAYVRSGRASTGIYAMPLMAAVSRTVVSSHQADAHVTELIAIGEAAN